MSVQSCHASIVVVVRVILIAVAVFVVASVVIVALVVVLVVVVVVLVHCAGNLELCGTVLAILVSLVRRQDQDCQAILIILPLARLLAD